MRFAFRLHTSLLVAVGVCSSWIVFGIGGILGFAILLTVAVYIQLDKSRWPAVVRVSVNLLWFLFGIALLPPAISTCRQTSLRVECMKNLKQIMLAVRSYEHEYGRLPPPCIYDATGRAMHSWRVLILPFLGCESLYKQYDFSEQWDGPNNRDLLGARPAVYACPADKIALAHGSTSTSYLAVLGANGAWQGDKMAGLDARYPREKLDTTVFIIETSDSGVKWTEPRELFPDDLHSAQLDRALIVRAPHMHSNGYFYYETPAGANVALADGCTYFLPADRLTVERLKHLLTVGGFTEENIAAYSSSHEEELQINWPNCFALPVWVAVVGLLLYQAVRSRKAVKRR